MNRAELVAIDPISAAKAKSCVQFLSAHRTLTLVWASHALDIAAHILRVNGWDLDSSACKLHSRHAYSGSPDWLREGSLQVARLGSKISQGLCQYSRALHCYGQLLRLMKRVRCREVLVEMVKIHAAKGDFILARNLLQEVLTEEYALRPLSGKETLSGDVFELLRWNKELALLQQYLDVSIDLLTETHGVGSAQQQLAYGVQDNGLLSRPVVPLVEVRNGRSLSDKHKRIAAEQAKEKDRQSLALSESRAEFKAVIAAEKDRVRALLAITC